MFGVSRRNVRLGQLIRSHGSEHAPIDDAYSRRLVDDGPILRIAQLNAGSLLEPDWDRRRHEILAWFERLDPDVVCLQEMWEDARTPNTAGWLVEQCAGGRWHWCFGGYPFPHDLWPDPSMRFGSAILSRWPIDEHHLDPLPVDDHPDPFRRLQCEVLHVRTAGLDVFSTHLVAAPDHADHRVRQVMALHDIVRSHAVNEPVPAPGGGAKRTSMPPVVCGDFNAEPESDEIRWLTSLAVVDGRAVFYQDAWRVGGDGPGWTQDWRRNPIAAAMNVHRKRIDYVLVGDPFQRAGGAGRVLGAAVAFDEPITGVVASDHFGLVVEVRWPTRPLSDGNAPGPRTVDRS